MRMTLGSRLLMITAAGIVPMFAILGYNEYSVRQARYLELHQLAGAAAQQAALEIERLLSGAENVLKAVSVSSAVESQDVAACTRYLADIKGQIPELSVIAVYGADGVSRCRSDTSQAISDLSDRPVYKDVLASPGRLVVGDYTISRTTGRAGVPLAFAIPASDGAIRGFVAAALDLDWLSQTLKARQIAKNGSLTIADKHGVIIAREPLPERFVGTRIPETFLRLVNADDAGSEEVVSQDGTRRIIGYIPASVPPVGLYLSVGIAVDQAFAEIDRGSIRAGVIALAASAIALLLAHGLSNRLVQGPVRRIERVLAARGKGRETIRTGMRADDGELEALGAEFDRFMDGLNLANEERRVAEERRQLMTHELSHRLKNIIATIQAVAVQTLRGRSDADALNAFVERLGSIATAHQLLLTGAEGSASVRLTIEASLGTFVGAETERVTLEGPELFLKTNAVQSLTMAIHELATNAVKYGALSNETGVVRIKWSLTDDQFHLDWLEKHGPPVEPPSRTGFGTRMIKRVLAMELRADVTMDYSRQGFHCGIAAPSSALLDAQERSAASL